MDNKHVERAREMLAAEKQIERASNSCPGCGTLDDKHAEGCGYDDLGGLLGADPNQAPTPSPSQVEAVAMAIMRYNRQDGPDYCLPKGAVPSPYEVGLARVAMRALTARDQNAVGEAILPYAANARCKVCGAPIDSQGCVMSPSPQRGEVEQFFAAWDAHCQALERTNEAIPPIDATKAEREVYRERYQASEEAKRTWFSAATALAQAGRLAAPSPDPAVWLPIESAPRGDWFLARWYAAAKDGSCRWVAVEMRRADIFSGVQYYEAWDGRLCSDPRFWMPLPSPPTTEPRS